MKRQVLKLDEKLIDYTKSATWNVWYQFGVDIDKYEGEKIDVSACYMPQEVQIQLQELMKKHGRLYTIKKNKRDMCFETLNYFPSVTLHV